MEIGLAGLHEIFDSRLRSERLAASKSFTKPSAPRARFGPREASVPTPQALCFADWPVRSELASRSIPSLRRRRRKPVTSVSRGWSLLSSCVLGFFPGLLGMIAGASGLRGRTAAYFLWHCHGRARSARDRERDGIPLVSSGRQASHFCWRSGRSLTAGGFRPTALSFLQSPNRCWVRC